MFVVFWSKNKQPLVTKRRKTLPYYVNRYSDDKKKWRGNRLGDRGHDNANVLVMQFGFP